jgi:adenylate cyclase class 2
MAKEIEMKVIGVDKNEVEARLAALGARHVADYEFKRVVFNLGGGRTKKHLRVRTDGKTTTLTLKERKGSGLEQTDEYETEVEDFKTTVRILCRAITSKPIYEFNRREEYLLNGVHIAIDKWPGIPWYVEIEGPSVGAVEKTYNELGIKGRPVGNITHGTVYTDYYNKDYAGMVKKNWAKLEEMLK